MAPRETFALAGSTAALLIIGLAASSPAVGAQGVRASEPPKSAVSATDLSIGPGIRIVPGKTLTVSSALLSRKEQKLADGRALVARAEQFKAGYVPAEGQPTKAELDAEVDKLRNSVDSLSEMGEMESLRLQIAMDRLSKMMSTLSNLLKKAGETQDSITQNIK